MGARYLLCSRREKTENEKSMEWSGIRRGEMSGLFFRSAKKGVDFLRGDAPQLSGDVAIIRVVPRPCFPADLLGEKLDVQ